MILPAAACRNAERRAWHNGGVRKARRTRRLIGSLVVDVVLVVAFAVIGRASHHETLTAGGVATTAWPFLAGLAAGWAVTRAWRAPTRPVRTGVPVWLVTVVVGMLLRVISGQGIATAFVIVAFSFLLLCLVGWRVLARVFLRPRMIFR